MSAIAGAFRPNDGDAAEQACLTLLEAQRRYGPDHLACGRSGACSAGRCLFRMLDEDRFDRQPERSDDGRLMLVADVRIDNRSELIAELGRARDEAAGLSDSALLRLMWERWGETLLDRLLGDFALAVWDAREETLTLARDPLGERPLHYARLESGFAFASMPQALARLLSAGVDEERLAEFVADLPPRGDRSFYRGVRKVEPGQIVTLSGGGARARTYWDPSFAEIRLPRQEDYAEALREQLDRAVARRLRRARGLVGAHLSSGYDSSAVATSAALALGARGERLLAFTSAPRAGFEGRVPAGRIADESPIAAETASLYGNVVHVVERAWAGPPLPLLGEANGLAGQPTGHVLNGAWWAQISARAASEGVSVMLTAEAGNFTLSAGLGLDELPGLVRAGRLARWWREARGLTAGDHSWANVLKASLQPWIPDALHRAARRTSAPAADEPSFVLPAWHEAMAKKRAGRDWDDLAALDGKARRKAFLGLVDPGNYRKRSLAGWGIEERDATADRRLAEFCFSLPLGARLKDGVRRPALRDALARRVPRSVLDQRLRGYQSADWYERVSGEDVSAFAAAMAGSGDRVLDFEAIRNAAASWPTSGFHERPVIYLYAMNLLRALSAAQFAADQR